MSATSATAEDRRLRFHFSPIITLAAVVVLAVLLGLGTWQAGRYRESSSFITVYEQKHGGPPVTALAVTPLSVSSAESAFTKPATPCLAAEYAASCGRPW